uniref:Putative tick til 14 n=1 Tax=Amblyomma aureolatum TaxID=187763 RepID=A0A1E1X097_9ACAR
MMKVALVRAPVLLALFAMFVVARGEVGSQLPWRPSNGLQVLSLFQSLNSSGNRRCPIGQVYRECQSSSCGELKCYQIFQRGPRACTADCKTGCFCRWPLFRDSRGRCVPAPFCLRQQIFGRLGFGQRPSNRQE